MGRNSVDEDIESRLPLIISMLQDNYTDKEIAEKLEISLSTWRRKKSQNNKIKAAIDEVKDERNRDVEDSLLKCCKGYPYYEEVVTKVKEEYESSTGQILTREDVKISKVKKYARADIVAIKYWLNNRKKAVWKDDPNKAEIEKGNLKIKNKEFELKEKEIKNKEW